MAKEKVLYTHHQILRNRKEKGNRGMYNLKSLHQGQ